MKFLVDMPLSPSLAVWLTQQGYQAVHALGEALDRSPDEAVLERARREKQVVITADLDYPRLLALTRAEGPGLILFRGGDWSEREARDRLARVLQTIPVEEFPRSIIVIERSRIRRRRLPIEPGL